MRRPRRVSRHLARQPFGTRRAARCPSLRTRQGPLPVPHDTSRHDLVPATPVCPAGAGSLPRLGGPPGRHGPPPSARYRECGVRCHAMRRPRTLLLCSKALAQLLDAAFTRRALRPGNVACGDQCVRGTLAPRHHAGTNDLLSKALGATGRKADFAPRHYRIPPPGDMPRKATSAASGRRPVVTGRCASDRAPDEHRRAADHRLVGAGRRLSLAVGSTDPRVANDARRDKPARTLPRSELRARQALSANGHDTARCRISLVAPATRPATRSATARRRPRDRAVHPAPVPARWRGTAGRFPPRRPQSLRSHSLERTAPW